MKRTYGNRTESLNGWVDRTFERFNKPMTWLATCAILFLLVRLIVAAIFYR